MIKIEKISTFGVYTATYPRRKNLGKGLIVATTRQIRAATCPGTSGRIPAKTIKRYFRGEVRKRFDATAYYRR